MRGYAANVSFSCPVDLLQQLDQRAREVDLTRSWLLRRIVEEAVAQEYRQEEARDTDSGFGDQSV